MRRIALVILTACLVGGCRSEPEPAEAALPTLADIRSRTPATAASPAQTPQPAARRHTFVVHRLHLPIDARLDEAWSLVREQAIGPRTRQAWAINGLRVGVLDQSAWRAFAQALPATITRQAQRMNTMGDPLTIPAGPRFARAAQIRLALPPFAGDEPAESDLQVTSLQPGRCQFLLNVDRNVFGSLWIRPHHHYPKLTVHVRSPQEKALDGRIFDELGLRVSLSGNQMLVIALDQRIVEIDRRSDDPRVTYRSADAGDDDANDADTDDGHDAAPALMEPRVRVEQPLDRLGAALLAGQQHGKAVQMVIVIDPE